LPERPEGCGAQTVPDPVFPLIPIGPAEVLRQGETVTIVSWGKMLDVVGQALSMMEDASAEVVNLRTLKPFDRETIAASVRKTGRLVIVEEGVLYGGLSAEISAHIAATCLEYLEGPIIRVGMPDVPIPASRPLEDHLVPRPEQVVEAVRRTRSF